MAVVKLSMLFHVATGGGENDPALQRTGGWSENWYDDVSLDNPAVKTAFRRFCAARAALLPTSAFIIGQRYQSIDPAGPSSVELMRYPGLSGETDHPNSSLYCKLAGINVRQTRPTWIRCIPDDFCIRGEFKPSRVYSQRLEAFAAQAQDWNFKCQDLGNDISTIIGIESDGTFSLSEALPGLAAGQRVKIVRTTVNLTERQVGGYFTVVAPASTTTGKLFNWPHGESSKGTMRLANFIYPTIPANALTIGTMGTRKIGKPFFSFVGRQSKRR